MTVIRHSIACEPSRFVTPDTPRWAIRPVDPARDGAALRGLSDACRQHVSGGRSAIPANLAAEVVGRADRPVHAWMASAPDDDPPGPEAVGCIVLTSTVVPEEAASGRRFSIAWLLVHPSFRRRGVATSLVARAILEARGQDAKELRVETLEAWPEATAFWTAVTNPRERSRARSRQPPHGS